MPSDSHTSLLSFMRPASKFCPFSTVGLGMGASVGQISCAGHSESQYGNYFSFMGSRSICPVKHTKQWFCIMKYSVYNCWCFSCQCHISTVGLVYCFHFKCSFQDRIHLSWHCLISSIFPASVRYTLLIQLCTIDLVHFLCLHAKHKLRSQHAF